MGVVAALFRRPGIRKRGVSCTYIYMRTIRLASRVTEGVKREGGEACAGRRERGSKNIGAGVAFDLLCCQIFAHSAYRAYPVIEHVELSGCMNVFSGGRGEGRGRDEREGRVRSTAGDRRAGVADQMGTNHFFFSFFLPVFPHRPVPPRMESAV